MAEIRFGYHCAGRDGHPQGMHLTNISGDFIGAYENGRLIGSSRFYIEQAPIHTVIDAIEFYGQSIDDAYSSLIESSTPKIPSFSFRALFVRPEFRRRAVATQILEAGIRHATRLGLSRALLAVEPQNIPAVKLYAKCGFIPHDEVIPATHRFEDLRFLVYWITSRPTIGQIVRYGGASC